MAFSFINDYCLKTDLLQVVAMEKFLLQWLAFIDVKVVPVKVVAPLFKILVRLSSVKNYLLTSISFAKIGHL